MEAIRPILESLSFSDDDFESETAQPPDYPDIEACIKNPPNVDQSDKRVTFMLTLLSVVNLFVIVQGFFSLITRIRNLPVVYSTVFLFYFSALSCLMIAEIYFLAGYF